VTPLPPLELSAISKDYRGLRPLRIEKLVGDSADAVAILGFDRVAAEVFINLITGATLPDSGEVRLFGRATADISDSADWLAVVDRFGIVTDRAVLLTGMSVAQNLAMPFTLEIEPVNADVRRQTMRLAEEVELPPTSFDRIVAELDAGGQARVRLARALALDPRILVLDHASAGLSRDDVSRFGRLVGAAGRRRQAAILALTADREFADAVAGRVLTHHAATGHLEGRRGWLSRLRGG
jgi:ABC-type transporter Mla maintaining outer membrane lipid asymmetry ATPase subunit MlaF